MRAQEIWHGDETSARVMRAALLPLSWLYAFGWKTYLAAYRLGLKKPKEPHRPIVCVGALVVGGSGKTPLTLHLADVIRELDRTVVISCSGYRSTAATGAALAPEGPLRAADWGDEPAMMRWLRPDLPLIVGRDRVRAAELCHRRFPEAVLLLDDGFQHLPLKKHATLLLEDPQAANAYCLPAGPYREPLTGLRRADMVLLSGNPRIEDSPRWIHEAETSGQREDLEARQREERIAKIAHASGGRSGKRPPSEFRVVPNEMSLVTPEGTPVDPAEHRGALVNVLCALGNPKKFVHGLVAAGMEVERAKLLPDHDPFDEGNLWDHFEPGLPVVVTAKDWVKLRERPDLVGRTIWIARYELRVEPAHEFREWIRRRLEAVA